MKRINDRMVRMWERVGPRFLPFADAATDELPLSRLLRLSLFQVSVGMATALLVGTLNRVMIVELGVPAGLVAVMIALPVLFAPLRALIGHRSDHHRSVLGWKRVPYIWMGTMAQFGGFAIMPFALLVLSHGADGPQLIGQAGAALAFLLVGAGIHTVQTVGLALATDLAPERAHARVVVLLCLMQLVGMVAAALLFGSYLRDYNSLRLIQVVQGAAVLSMVLNVVALWKQEARDPGRTRRGREEPSFREALSELRRGPNVVRRLVAVGLGTVAFAMQDVLLEPYGGQVLGLSVGATTELTALMAGGGILAFALSSRALNRGGDPHRLAAFGALAGIAAFAAVVFAAPLGSAALFASGAGLIGFGSGLFVVGTLTAAMEAASPATAGLALGTWGAVQATAAGSGVALGGLVRDAVSGLAGSGALGEALAGPTTGYSFVYHLEILLLFATLAAIGPLVRWAGASSTLPGLAGLPGQPSHQTR
jgi:BCD family chlorophyll transporter-like MFS transporter